MLEKELEIARGLAFKAAEAIMGFYADEIVAEAKLGPDKKYEPVTAADRAASRILVDGLSAAFPDDAILSEEDIDPTFGWTKAKRTWIIDPIDGTAGFIKHEKDFAVQIGLAEDGKPIAGVVHLPAFGITYEAALGEGAFATADGVRKRLFVREADDPREMCVAVSRNHFSPRMDRLAEFFGFASKARRGSVGLKIGLIAAQKCDVYIHLSNRTKLWDTCGPQIILEEAGGILTDTFGRKIDYSSAELSNLNGLVACGASAHPQIIEGLKTFLAESGDGPKRR